MLRPPATTSSPATAARPAETTTLTAAQIAALGELIIDVRRRGEYDAGHVEGAILIPVSIIEQKIAMHAPNKTRKIIPYCKIGERSGTALNKLMRLGYTNARNGYGFTHMIDAGYKKAD